MPRLRLALLTLALLVTACGVGGDDEANASESTDGSRTTTGVGSTETGPDPTSGTTAPPSTESSTASSSGSATSSTTTAVPEPSCRPVADFEDLDELQRWQVVNDGVMGGRSSAEAEVVDGVLILGGEIVTDGGGFSSVRLALDGPLTDATGLLLRLRTDGRAYEVTLADAAPGRDRRTSHQAAIPAVGGDTWDEVLVDFDDLDASIFGRPVDVEPFQPASATELGIILADGTDGPFRIELDWVRACP